MAVEAGHIQLTEYNKEIIPKLNYMMEDLFCRYGVSIPYYLLDFSFPDYQIEAKWPAPYSPEWLALYKPSIPTWPELPGLYMPSPLPSYDIQWPSLYGAPWPQIQWPSWFQLPGMEWPEWQKLPWVDWPKLPELPRLELPPWPEMEWPEWERFELEWPEWDWPDWESPESEKTRWRGRRRRWKAREWPVPWWPFKPEWQRTWPYETEWRGITWPSDFGSKPEWQRTWPYKTEWRGITWLNGNTFGSDWGESDYLTNYNLNWLNKWLEMIQDEAGVAVEQLNDLSPQSMEILNNIITENYESVSADYTYNSQTKDGYLEKFGESQADPGSGTWTDAWDDMVAYTPDVYTADTIHSILFLGQYKRTPGGTKNWAAYRDRGYLSFDTSPLSGKTITVVTLKLYIKTIVVLHDYETSRIVNVYGQNWDTLDVNDWNGGTLVATFDESDLTVDNYYTITLTDISTINKTGETQFEIAAKADVDGAVITDPTDLYVLDEVFYRRGGVGFGYATGDATSNKPILTVTATG